MHILVVEDDVEIALFIAGVLQDRGHAVDRCESGADALRRVRATAYDLVILDWVIPDLDGIQVCRQLRRGGSNVFILMLSARDRVSERVTGLEAGADDYLVKPFCIEELLARIHALVRRATAHGELHIGPLRIDRVAYAALVENRPVELTRREFALLVYLAERCDRLVTRTELLSHVWALKYDPESNVIDVHISRLRDKLGKCAWMVETVRGRGYRLRTGPPP